MSVQPKRRCEVVLLCYRSASDIDVCLRRLRDVSAEIDLRITLVDNASPDDDVEVARGAGVDFALLSAAENRGYAAGNNLAIRKILDSGSRDPILILNPDAVLGTAALARMLQVLDDHPEVGLACPWTVDDDATSSRPRPFRPLFGLRRPTPLTEDPRLVYVDRLHGCCMLVRPEIFERVGFIDEDYFLYFEEIDFSYLAARAGWASALCLDVTTVHRSSPAKLHRIFYMWRNAVRFCRRNAPRSTRLRQTVALARFWLSMSLELIELALKGRWRSIPAAADGLVRGASGEVGRSASRFARTS